MPRLRKNTNEKRGTDDKMNTCEYCKAVKPYVELLKIVENDKIIGWICRKCKDENEKK